MAVTTDGLIRELMGLVRQETALSDRAYYVFNVDDLTELVGSHLAQLPLAGVSFVGRVRKPGHAAQGKASAGAARTAYLRCAVLVVDRYTFSAEPQGDTKPSITALLDALRDRIEGQVSGARRVWDFVGETPLETRLKDVIAYGQVWETVVVVSGNIAQEQES